MLLLNFSACQLVKYLYSIDAKLLMMYFFHNTYLDCTSLLVFSLYLITVHSVSCCVYDPVLMITIHV